MNNETIVSIVANSYENRTRSWRQTWDEFNLTFTLNYNIKIENSSQNLTGKPFDE